MVRRYHGRLGSLGLGHVACLLPVRPSEGRGVSYCRVTGLTHAACSSVRSCDLLLLISVEAKQV